MQKLKIIPYYTGKEFLEEALKDKRSLNLLWLEILLNDTINWKRYLFNKEIRLAYEKASVWYSNFKSIVESYLHRKPLKIKKERINSGDYRRFLEALNFVIS